jgi:hypothetical protein
MWLLFVLFHLVGLGHGLEGRGRTGAEGTFTVYCQVNGSPEPCGCLIRRTFSLVVPLSVTTLHLSHESICIDRAIPLDLSFNSDLDCQPTGFSRYLTIFSFFHPSNQRTC